MKIEQQLCNPKLAKRLKKLGVEQESVWYWGEIQERQNGEITGVKLFDVDTIKARRHNNPHLKDYSAFTVAELGERLKPHLDFIKGHMPQGTRNKALFYDFRQLLANANTYAKMLIYLLEKKLITPN